MKALSAFLYLKSLACLNLNYLTLKLLLSSYLITLTFFCSAQDFRFIYFQLHLSLKELSLLWNRSVKAVSLFPMFGITYFSPRSR